MFLETEEVDIFRDVLNSVCSIHDEGEIKIDDDCVSISVMNPSQAYMIQTKFDKKMFIKLNKPDFKIITNLQYFYNLIKSKTIKSFAILKKNGEVVVETKGTINKTANLPIYNTTANVPDVKDIKFDVSLIAKVKKFKEAIYEICNSFASSGTNIIFKVKDKKLILAALKDNKWIKFDVNIDVNCDKDFEVKYALDLINKFMGIKDYDDSEVIFGDDIPIIIKFMKKDKFMVRGILAPKVDRDN